MNIVTFRQAVDAAPGLRGAFCEGLQALRRSDGAKIECKNPRRVIGSIDLDEHLAISCPDDPRWDCGIGVKSNGAEEAVWVEVHPASSAHVGEVLRKLKWLKNWLERNAPDLRAMTSRYCWVASGSVSLRPGSREYMRIADEGLTFTSRCLRIE
jgi:hypothetical protein